MSACSLHNQGRPGQFSGSPFRPPPVAASSGPAPGTLPSQTPLLSSQSGRLLWPLDKSLAGLAVRAAAGYSAAPTQHQQGEARHTHTADPASPAFAPLWPCPAVRNGRRSRALVAAAGLGRSSKQTAGAGASTSQPRSPGNQAPLSTDLLIQRLEAAADAQSVLQLLKQPRNASAEQAFLCTAALKALARLLGGTAAAPLAVVGAPAVALLGRGGKPLSRDELQELQEAVRGMINEVHSRRGVLSLPLLSDTLNSLEVLLPALGGWRVAGLRADDAALRLLAMATDVPQAAADADALRPVPLPALRNAARVALRLTQMAQQAPSPQVESTTRRVREAVQTYLRRAVFPAAEEGGQAAAAARLHGADLAAMAAAAELAVMWDVEVPPEVMQLHVRHVDRLLSAAAGPAYIVSADVHAEQHSVAGQGTSRSGDDNTSTSHHAQGRGNGRAEPRGRGGRGGGGRVGRGSSASQQERGAAGVSGTASDRTEPPLPDGLVAAGQLDVTSLAQLLIAWASVPAGRPAPSVEWLDRASALALRTQDPTTMAKRGQLMRKLRRLRSERQQAAEELRRLLAAATAAGPEGQGGEGGRAGPSGPAASDAKGIQPDVQQDRNAGAARGGGRGQGRGGRLARGGRGRGAAAANTAHAAPLESGARAPGGQPPQPQQPQLDDTGSLKARLKDIGRDVEALQQELAALGPVASAPPGAAVDARAGSVGGPAAAGPAPTPASGWKRRQEEPEASAGASTAAPAAKRPHLDQKGPQYPGAALELPSTAGAQLSYALASGVLTGLLWAVSGRLGSMLTTETRALARAVAVARMSDFTSPQQIVAVLYSLGRMKSVPAREEVGEFTKRLRPHLESLSPTDAVRLLQALEALDYNPPAKPWQAQPPASSQPTRTGKAGKADTAQPAADAGFPPSGAEVIGRLMVMVDGLGSRGGGGGGLAAAPSDLILELLRSCAAWSVPFPETYLGALESIVEQRVLRSLPLDKIKLLSPRAMATAAQASYGYVPTAVASDADVNADVMRAGLLDGVILPLAATRQGFVNGDMFYLALWDWMEVKACEGITVDKATSLINSYAYNKSWALVPQLRKVMEGLMERALQLPVSQPREGSKLLLAVGRALRVMGDKMQCMPADSIADKVAPGVAPLLLPAVERLASQDPNASDVAAAVKGLLVEARWRVPVSADSVVEDPARNNGCDVDPRDASEQATRRLLAKLAVAAERKLDGTRVLSFAWLLEGFAALQYRPSHDTLAQLYGAAAARLAERPAKAEEVVELLNSVTGMDRVASEPAPATAAAGPMAAGGSAPATGRRGALGDELKARGRLLQQLAVAVLQEPALPALASVPDALVAAVKQMAILGMRPPVQWLSSYTAVLQALLPKLSSIGLAYGAEGLALLGAAPPSSFLDILLTCTDKHGADRFEPHALGLLLGGAHALRQNALAAQAAAELRLRGVGDDDEAEEERAHTAEAADVDPAAWRLRQAATGVPVVAPLSTAAQEAWGRAHVAFVSEARKSNPMPRYSRAQQLLVVSAVTSFELSRPPLSQGQQAAAGSGPSKAGRGNSKAASAGAVADFRARLEADWLAETCASLLASRKAEEATIAGGSRGGGNPALLPTPAMLESLLRLATRVLGGRTDGAITRLVKSGAGSSTPLQQHSGGVTAADEQTLAQEAARSNVVEFVRLSVQDLSRSVSGRHGATSFPAWVSLLRAALEAGIRLSPAELGVFASTLLNMAARRTRRALTAKGPISANTTEGASADGPAAASAGSGAGARSLSAEGRERMTAVWQDVEEGLEGVLLPVLPWVPPLETLRTLRLGLLEQSPAVLTAASLRQLALMCTYTTQAAPQLAEEAARGRRTLWWSTVRAELLRRAQDEEVEKAWSKAQRGSSSNRSAATAEADLQTAVDLAAACYGLLMHGGGSREGRDSASGGGAAPSSASLPDELATWMKLLLTRAGSGLAAKRSLGKGLAGVRALQLLWVARSVGCAHLLPASVWSTAFGALGPEQAGAAALQPRQLAQLVVLRAEALRGSGDSATGNGPLERLPTRAGSSVPVAGWFLEVWLDRLAVSCQRVLLSKRASADADGVTPAVAFLAVAYCLPPDQQRPREYAAVLAKAALPALSGSVGTAAGADVTLLLADLWAFLRRVEGWPVTGSGSSTGDSSGSENESDASWTGLPVEAAAAVCQRVLAVAQTGAQAAGGFIMPPSEAVQFTVTLLNATAVESSCASALEAALPLLQALVPEAEAEVWALATRERLGRAVLASALQAALNAVTNTEPPLGADGAIASACEVAALMVGSVAVLLQQAPQQPIAAQVANSRAASVVSRLDARSLPPDQLAALASAIIRLCPPAAGGAAGEYAAARIPQAAAAVLLRLMSAAEVVERLPITRLEAALTRFLPAQQQQHEGQAPEAGSQLPMTEAVAQAISAKLQVGSTAWFARTPVGLAVQLHRCGASGVLLQRALLADRDWAGREVQLLQALAMAAPREPLALSLRDYGDGNTLEALSLRGAQSARAAGRGEGPLSCLALDITQSLRRTSRQQRLGVAAAAAWMGALAELLPHLEGTAGSYLLYGAFNWAGRRALIEKPKAMREIREEPASVWRLLEALLALAGECLNKRAFAIVMRKMHVRHGTVPKPEDPMDAARDQQRFDVQEGEFTILLSYISRRGPYLIQDTDARLLLAAMQPVLDRHQQRMEQLLQEQSAANHPGSTSSSSSSTAGGAAAAAYWWPPGCAQPPAGRLVAGLRLPEGDPDLLSARQLGLLYGAVVIRGPGAQDEVPYSLLAAEAQQLYLAYITSLNLLAGRTDLPPHEHLEAMLGALEPAVFFNPSSRVLPAYRVGSDAAADGDDGQAADTEEKAEEDGDDGEGYDFYSDRLPIEHFLAPVLARYARAGAEEQPRPAGLELWDDVTELYSPADLSEQSMLAMLYNEISDEDLQAWATQGLHAASRESGSSNDITAGGHFASADTGSEAAARKDGEGVTTELMGEAGGAGFAAAVPAAQPRTGGRGIWAGRSRPEARPAHDDVIQLFAPDVTLPTHLRLPPGRRHGQPGGDPAADAAREAYVRSIVPSFGLLRRLTRMMVATERQAVVYAALEASPGFEGFGEGRWARLLHFAVALDKAQERAKAELAAADAEATAAARINQSVAALEAGPGSGAQAVSASLGRGRWGGALKRMASDMLSSIAPDVVAEGEPGANAAATTGTFLQEWDEDEGDFGAAEVDMAADVEAEVEATAGRGASGLQSLHAPASGGAPAAAERQPGAPGAVALIVAADSANATHASEATAGGDDTGTTQVPADANPSSASASSPAAQVNPFEVTADFKRRLETMGYQVPEQGARAPGAAGGRRRPPGMGAGQQAAQDAGDVGKAVLDAAAWVGGALGSYLGKAARSVVRRAPSRPSSGDASGGGGGGPGTRGGVQETAQAHKDRDAPAHQAAPGPAEGRADDAKEDRTDEGAERAWLDDRDDDSTRSRRLRRKGAGPNRPQDRGFGKGKK